MPYIKKEKRRELDPWIDNLFVKLKDKGDFNYSMTRLLHMFVKKQGICYHTLSDAHGIISDVKSEFYRTIVSKYEEEKIKSNGDIGIL